MKRDILRGLAVALTLSWIAVPSLAMAELLCVGGSGTIRADLRTGEVRTAAESETLTYSTDWDGGDTAAVAVDGTTLSDALSGSGTIVWMPPSVVGTYELTHTVVTGGVEVVLRASFRVKGTLLCMGGSGAIRADLRTGEVRAAEVTEKLTYSTEWDGGDTATVAVNDNSVFQGSGSGTYLWTPSVDGLNELTHTVITSGVSVVETARFMVTLGTPDKPWRIGATANDTVVAWTNETGTLVIEGAGAMKDFAADGSDLPWPSAAIHAVAIADGVTRIGAYAYKGCSGVTAIEVPASVATVGSGAFQDCSSLKSVTFKGQAPACGDNVFTGAPADMVVYAEAGTAGWVQWNGRPLAFVNSGSGSETLAKAQLTVTNVVIHYVVNSVMPEKVYPATNDTGFVNIITEVKTGGAVAVPETWADNYPDFKEKFGDNFTKSLMKPTGKRDGAGNAMCVWQDYVAGTDPTDENDKFTASITTDADGNLIISYSPELTDAEKALRVYKTWGKVKLQDTDWVEVPEGHNADYNFFKVTVEMK